MWCVYKYINIKDIPEKADISSMPHDCECITCVCNGRANMILCYWRFPSGSLSNVCNEHVERTLFFECFHVVDGIMVVFDLLHRKCYSSSNARTHRHFICAFYQIKTNEKKTEKSFGRKSERISDMLCNRKHVYLFI